MAIFIQALVNGLMMGGVYASIAVGLSLIFGVMHIVNWAHGECLMLGMYLSYLVIRYTNMNPYLSIILVAPIMCLFGYALQRLVFNNLLDREKSREPRSVLMWTAGMEMVITSLTLIVFSANPIMVKTTLAGKTFSTGDIVFVNSKFISFIIAIGITLALYFYLQKAETGRAMRAISQNRDVASLMGINQKRLFNLASAIAMGLVGVSAVLLIPYFPISPSIGITFGTRSFIIVVLGGKGNVLGALVGGLLIGVIGSVGGQYLSMAYAEVIIFIVFVAVLLFKPAGLLNRKTVY